MLNFCLLSQQSLTDLVNRWILEMWLTKKDFYALKKERLIVQLFPHSFFHIDFEAHPPSFYDFSIRSRAPASTYRQHQPQPITNTDVFWLPPIRYFFVLFFKLVENWCWYLFIYVNGWNQNDVGTLLVSLCSKLLRSIENWFIIYIWIQNFVLCMKS